MLCNVIADSSKATSFNFIKLENGEGSCSINGKGERECGESRESSQFIQLVQCTSDVSIAICFARR